MPLSQRARLRAIWATQASWSSGEVAQALGVSMVHAGNLIRELRYYDRWKIEKIPETRTTDARYRVKP